MEKQRQPLSYCTKCGKVYRGTSSLDGGVKCSNIIDGNGSRCKGAVIGAFGSNNWKECPSCGATGYNGSLRCDQCRGEGWYYSRY